MELGWCDVCLRVADVTRSREFYAGIGFRRVEGDDEEGWAVVVHDSLRLGLYDSRHGWDGVTLNFRGGDVRAIAAGLASRGYSFESEPRGSDDTGWSAVIRDPDGNALFFDTAPGETKKT